MTTTTTTATTKTRRRSSRALLAGAALIATAALASPAAAATGPASASTNATTDQPATVAQPRPRFEVVSSPSFEGQSDLGPDNRQKKHPTNQRPFDDVNVRKAVTAGFDRRATNPTP